MESIRYDASDTVPPVEPLIESAALEGASDEEMPTDVRSASNSNRSL